MVTRLLKPLLPAILVIGMSSPLAGQETPAQIPAETLTLEAAMDIAANNSPALRRSFMNLDRYRQILIAQRASLKSRFSLNLNPVDYSKNRRFENRLSQWYTNETFSTSGTFRIDQPILLTDGEVSLINTFGWQNSSSDSDGSRYTNKAFSNSFYVQISQPIFTYNRRKMELKQIEFDLENANISYALQRLETERNITSNFYSVYMAQSNLEIAREELRNAEQSHGIIRDKVEADLAAREELFQAELNLATAQSSVEERVVALANAKDQLKRTLGMSLNDDFVVWAEVNITPVDIDVDRAVENGLANRLELRQRSIESENLNFQLIQTKALNEFRGDISLSLGVMGDHSDFGRIYDNPTQNPRVSISFTVPIFDWGEKKARIKAQEVARNMNRMEEVEDRLDIEVNIRQVWRNLESLKTQITIAAKNVENAQLTYDLNQTKYREGDISGMEMNQFQSQLSSKKMAYAQAQINYKIELLNMKVLSLYDFEHNFPIVPITNAITDKK